MQVIFSVLRVFRGFFFAVDNAVNKGAEAGKGGFGRSHANVSDGLGRNDWRANDSFTSGDGVFSNGRGGSADDMAGFKSVRRHARVFLIG